VVKFYVQPQWRWCINKRKKLYFWSSCISITLFFILEAQPTYMIRVTRLGAGLQNKFPGINMGNRKQIKICPIFFLIADLTNSLIHDCCL
jgi:hypothetical protein